MSHDTAVAILMPRQHWGGVGGGGGIKRVEKCMCYRQCRSTGVVDFPSDVSFCSQAGLCNFSFTSRSSVHVCVRMCTWVCVLRWYPIHSNQSDLHSGVNCPQWLMDLPPCLVTTATRNTIALRNSLARPQTPQTAWACVRVCPCVPVCLWMCAARLWAKGFKAKYDSEKMDLVVVKLGED